MDDTLGTDVAVTPGSHLAVHRHPQPKHPVVVGPAGVVGDHLASKQIKTLI